MQDPVKKTILDMLELHKLPESQQIKILEGIGQVVYEAVFMRVMDTLDEKQQAEFTSVLERAKTPDEVLSFLTDRVPNFDQLVQEEVEKFREDGAQFLEKLG
ncbi:MAG: hypothetical protein RL681_643 [Candidatus Parcubacteria bacterium]|jgi:hypothetical protein